MSESAPKRHYGWQRSLSMSQFKKFRPPVDAVAALPASVDLSPGVDHVDDQGALGSCGPNAVDALIAYDQKAQGLAAPFGSSRLYTYYNTRLRMGTTAYDSGVDNATMMQALAEDGYCPESLWPYNLEQFTQEPSADAYAFGRANLITDWGTVDQQAEAMKACLAAGRPFVFGFTVYESFESAQTTATGDVPLPRRRERIVGGHDILFVGYDDASQRFKFLNSWGKDWGRKGFGTFPYSYATDPAQAGDFATINRVPSPDPDPTPTPTPTPLEGQIVIDLGTQSVTLPAGWTKANADLLRKLRDQQPNEVKRRALAADLVVVVLGGNQKGASELARRKHGVSAVDWAALIQLILQILVAAGIL